MQKILIISAFVILFLLIGGWAILHYIGDIRPALIPAVVPSLTSSNPSSQPILNSGNFDSKSLPQKRVSFDLKLAERFSIGVFAENITGVRDLQLSPEGVLLASSPSQGSVFAFTIENGTVTKKTVISGLSEPHGLAFNKGKLFIAENNRLGRYSWDSSTSTAVFEKELMKLRSGSHDAHTIVFDKNGSLFVKVGSSCNVCQESDSQAATVIKTDSEGSSPVTFAKGLRNAAFMTLHPETGDIWATENGRDMIGDDIPPEEINIIGNSSLMMRKSYGWPNCYGNKVIDRTFYKGNDPAVCEDTEAPFHLMQAHSAPLGLTFIPESFSNELKSDLLVAFHGSWNRSVPTGYKVVRLNLDNGKVVGEEDFLSGFLQGSSALGRPVDVEFDKNGNLFISDDKTGSIYVISKK
jgi:glucose/arabinose dehydrogenase